MKVKKLLQHKDLYIVLIMSFVFALSYMQMPLYTSNQNAYFLHGLAGGGYGFLSRDWLAGCADHIPLFSLVVKITYGWGLSPLFYLYHGILVMIYFLSLFGILERLFKFRNKTIPLFLSFVLIVFFHCLPLHYLIANKLPVLKTLPREMLLFTEGLAGQYVLGPYFQPSAFGIFLIFSLFLFLQKKEIAAGISAVAAAAFHSSYILQAALLIAVYAILLIREKRMKQGLMIVIVALILVSPSLAYLYLNFKPANSEILQESQSILINYRLAHHVKTHYWFHARAMFQILLVILGIIISRRDKKLFPVMMFLCASSLLLTLIQLLTRNKTLALMFPWRTSVILVPVSVILLIGWFWEKLSKWIRLEKMRACYSIPLHFLLFAIVLLMGGLGLNTSITKIRSSRPLPVSRYVKEMAQEDDVYLVPVSWEWFRLQSGVPIFVDSKSHPYKDTDVIEWHKRMTLARAFYGSKETGDAEKNLKKIIEQYGITRVIVETGFPDLSQISLCKSLYKGDTFHVYGVNR